jgi:hypothetical protein
MSTDTTRAWLVERQALAAAATEGPWEAHTWKGVTKNLLGEKRDASGAELSVVPSDGVYGVMSPEDAEFIADSRTSVPAMAAALTAVLDLHRPMGIYSMEHGDCDHADPESCPPVETDAGTMCGDSPDYYACEECMDVGGELSPSYPEHPCATVRAIQAALGGEE